MKEKCIFCKKNHLPINSKFEEFITNDSLEYEKIITLMELIEKELVVNHWNEVFCMISTTIKVNKIPKNTAETIFLLTLRDIHNCMRYKPELNKIQKIIKNLTSQLVKIAVGKITRVKNTENSNDFNEEIKRLNEIFVKLKEQSNIEPSLKNYVVYRLMTFFEYKSYDTIKQAIDATNDNQTQYGEVVIGDAAGILEDLNKVVMLILENTVSAQENSTIKLNNEKDNNDNPNARFFEFLKEVIEITSPDLKKYFDDKYQGDWFKLIKKLKDERNAMAHQMSDVKYEVNELESITNLMKIFFIAFPNILKCLTQIIPKMRRDDEMEKGIIVIDQTLNRLTAKIISMDSFYHILQKTFDLDFYNKEFEKNKQNGTVKWFDQNKAYGFIKREGGSDLHVKKSNVNELINEGDAVEFLVGKGAKGPEAIRVRKIA